MSALLVSPHLDDATLSCAGAITRLVAAGEDVTVVTVCTADDETGDRASRLARRSHASWGLGSMPFGPRRAEDEEALHTLGARAVHLGLVDAVYRRDAAGRPLYERPTHVGIAGDDLTGFLAATRAALAESLAAEPDALVLAPLGLGGHVDHLLVRRAVEELRDTRGIVYYEEYPYLTGEVDLPPTDEGCELALLHPTPAELETRIEAVACYRSQLRGLFPTFPERVREILSARIPVAGRLLDLPDTKPAVDRVRARLCQDVARCGGERYWCPPDSPFRRLLDEWPVPPSTEGGAVSPTSTRGYSPPGTPLGTG